MDLNLLSQMQTTLVGRINADGSVKVISVLGLLPGLMAKVNCELNRRDAAQPIPSSCVVDTLYRGSDWTAGLNAVMVEGRFC